MPAAAPEELERCKSFEVQCWKVLPVTSTIGRFRRRPRGGPRWTSVDVRLSRESRHRIRYGAWVVTKPLRFTSKADIAPHRPRSRFQKWPMNIKPVILCCEGRTGNAHHATG